MIRATDFYKACGCRSVGECQHNLFAECDAFDAVVDGFAAAMKAKFRRKYVEGRHGWDDPAQRDGITRAMVEHACKAGYQTVDVANLAAMLWNFDQPEIDRTPDNSEVPRGK